MDKYQEMAALIIDEVCTVIERNYDIEPKNLNEGSDIEDPALINGTQYYDLEDSIVNRMRR